MTSPITHIAAGHLLAASVGFSCRLYAQDAARELAEPDSVNSQLAADESQAMLGVGLNWNRPKRSTSGAGLRDQYSLEFFQQVQQTAGLQITPGIQVVKNPALAPSDEWGIVLGLRLRAAL